MSRERLRRFGAIRRARDTRVTPRAVAPWLLALLLVGIPPVPAAAQTGWGLAVVNGDFFLPSLERGQILRVRRDGGVTVLLDDIHCHSLAPGYDGFIYAESVGTGAGGTVMWSACGNWGPTAIAPTCCRQRPVPSRGSGSRVTRPDAPIPGTARGIVYPASSVAMRTVA